MSVPHSDSQGAAASAAGIGRSLRQAREARGLTVGDAAHALKLTLRQVEALEADDFEHLPGTAFARGFLRNYARLLHLDPDPLIGAFDAYHAGAAVELRPISNAQGALPAGGGRGGPSAMPATLAAAALLGVVVAGWYFDWFRQPKSLAPVESSAPVAVLPPLEATPVAPAATPGSAEAAPVGNAPLTPPTAEVLPAPVAADPSAPAPAPDGLERLAFSFSQEAWVEVRDASGEIIFSRISKAGSTQEVQGKGPFAVVVGNAENVRLSRNGQAVDLAPHIRSSVARLTLQ